MRVPMTWLAEYCDPGMPAEELASRLAMTGTEVERVVRHGALSGDNFVVGKVLTREQHPDADRLSVCSVDVGEDEPVTIVCGAPNVDAGQTVAVARPGAVMPDGTKLKKAKLRGVESNGMILAEDELEIGGDHTGIMQLELDPVLSGRDFTPGTPLEQALTPGEDVLELEITPNRPDCLGVYGVAREVHAITGNELATLATGPAPSGDESFPIEVQNHELCPRFTARIYRGVKVGPSPLWLKQRLSAAGQRPINNVVDITNYLMLLTGQPMHAFDLDKIRGGKLIVRNAAAGEKVTTLDDVERECDEHTVLVCDGEGPSAIAGIMGGAVSEVSLETTNVLLEIATWNGPNIHRTSQKLGLRSEASGRFEKGLSPELQLEVQQIAAGLMTELTGATGVSPTIDVAGEILPATPIELRATRLAGLLGTEIPVARCAEILRRLDFEVAETAGGLSVTPPHYRAADVTREADVIEEIARIEGVDSIPATLPAARSAIGRLSPDQKLKRRIEDMLAANGYSEAITWSFTSEALLAKLSPGGAPVERDLLKIANPLSEDHSVMRPLALPGLLQSAQHNLARGADAVRLFEIGAVYAGSAQEPREHTAVALLLVGPPTAGSWRGESDPGDFYVLKGIVQAVVDYAGAQAGYEPVDAAGHPYLIPGRSARVTAGEAVLGWVGELHPLVAKQFDLPHAVVAELNLQALAAQIPDPVTYEPISTFPPAREDIAVVVDAERPAEEVLTTVRKAGGKLLTAASVFDVYEGEQVAEGSKSLAIRLTYSAPDRTLTDDEVAAARVKITEQLQSIGGALRGQ
ncbi:MAG: phenylalanine--tRNA ligase subunit beta [Actinobacteria bacterium]|nr:phenylalanine--tRNA ligase subunit beta [Actinomycetota bacterium]